MHTKSMRHNKHIRQLFKKGLDTGYLSHDALPPPGDAADGVPQDAGGTTCLTPHV